MDDAAPNADDLPAPASYHWTPRLQRDFLESFATTGSVKISAAKVGMSPSAVYQLKQRPEGAAFKLGCAAALLIARGRLVDELLDRAIWGQEDTAEILREEGRSFAKRRRLDARLGLAMLARLDRMVDTRARAGEEMLAQIIAGDWAAFLTLFDVAETGAETGAGPAMPDGTAPETGNAGVHSTPLALWLAARDNRANPLAALWNGTTIANEVAQFSACSGLEHEAGSTHGNDVADMHVWHDEQHDEWRTNFPPPEGFVGIEEGDFGDEDYERTLDPDEEEAHLAALQAEIAPLRRAAEAARCAFFGFTDLAPDPAPDPANDPAPAGTKERKSARG